MPSQPLEVAAGGSSGGQEGGSLGFTCGSQSFQTFPFVLLTQPACPRERAHHRRSQLSQRLPTRPGGIWLLAVSCQPQVLSCSGWQRIRKTPWLLKSGEKNAKYESRSRKRHSWICKAGEVSLDHRCSEIAGRPHGVSAACSWPGAASPGT